MSYSPASIRRMRATTNTSWELFSNLARREVRSRYKGSVFGLAWTLIVPLVMMLTYTFVFSVLLPMNDGFPQFWLYLLSGLAFWSLFGLCFVAGATSLVANKNLVTKVKFRREILPMSALSSGVVTLIVMVAIMIPASIVTTDNHGVALLFLPVVLASTVLLCIGCALAMAVLNVYFRDLEHIVSALLIPWFFVTPIIYSFSSGAVEGHTKVVWVLTWLNPATPFVVAMQDVIYYGRLPSLATSVYIVCAGVAAALIGLAIFRRLQRDLAVEL